MENALRSRPGKSKILPASPTDLRSLVENYVYPLIVCEEEGKIVFYNSAAQSVFEGEELLGRPLPENWMQAENIEIETADAGKTPFRLIWEEILWDGNVAWYLVAVPAQLSTEAGPSLEETKRLRALLEESQEFAAVQTEELRVSLEKSQELAQAEVDAIRQKLEQSQEIAEGELSTLRAQLELAEDGATSVDELRDELERSVEMVAVEAEKRVAAESEREKLEAKLRDLHQRSLSKLEAARAALESERSERNELHQRLAKLKSETDSLREQLEEKIQEADRARHHSGEHFEQIKSELISKAETLSARDEELASHRERLLQAEQELVEKEAAYQARCQELTAAEERATRYRKDYEELDHEMAHAQEQSALLTAKLKSVESRLERNQRLMERDPNEFGKQSESEAEVEQLAARVEELEVELAATTAAARSRPEGPDSPPGDSDLGLLKQECSQLRAALLSSNSRISELENEVAHRAPESGDGAEASDLLAQLQDAKAVIEELRFHREFEYQEAQSALRILQDKYARLAVHGELSESPDLDAAGDKAAQLQRDLALAENKAADVEDLLRETTEQLKIEKSKGQQMPELQERVRVLEEDLREALIAATGVGAAAATIQDGSDNRIQELEAELSRARQGGSPEELDAARRRISELEGELTSLPQGASGGAELVEVNQQLQGELSKAREQLGELSKELRRTLEGDRETKKLAYADQLTGLPNLNLTGQYLQFCFERSGRGEGALALILIDLDHFRRVNDALGQKAGDELLKQVGVRLQRSVTEKDTAIARRGEDEFMVVAFMENARADGEQLMARIRGIAHNLLNELAKPFEILNQKVQVTASLGVALYPGPATDRTELLEQAEHAMYKSKESGRARVSFYTEDAHNVRERRKYLEQELRQGLSHNQFTMVYQPIYEISSSKVVGVEALLRWSHPTRGVLEPAQFLEVAEDSGLIVEIGEQVIPEALGVAKQKFMKRRFLSLNLSYRQLIDSGFSARFMKHLQLAGVPPHEVIVEVSERAARMDPERVKSTLASLAHWGVGVALDDFGTGTSEISNLVDLSLRVVKIDTSIIGRLPDDRAASKLCHAIAQMSIALEIPVLAEGVETREQLQQIATYGCQYAQGLVLGAPMTVSQLVQAL